jgi:hypothetical protein
LQRSGAGGALLCFSQVQGEFCLPLTSPYHGCRSRRGRLRLVIASGRTVGERNQLPAAAMSGRCLNIVPSSRLFAADLTTFGQIDPVRSVSIRSLELREPAKAHLWPNRASPLTGTEMPVCRTREMPAEVCLMPNRSGRQTTKSEAIGR